MVLRGLSKPTDSSAAGTVVVVGTASCAPTGHVGTMLASSRTIARSMLDPAGITDFSSREQPLDLGGQLPRRHLPGRRPSPRGAVGEERSGGRENQASQGPERTHAEGDDAAGAGRERDL